MTATIRHCENCGAKLEGDHAFCGSCGRPVNSEMPMPDGDGLQIEKETWSAVSDGRLSTFLKGRNGIALISVFCFSIAAFAAFAHFTRSSVVNGPPSSSRVTSATECAGALKPEDVSKKAGLTGRDISLSILCWDEMPYRGLWPSGISKEEVLDYMDRAYRAGRTKPPAPKE